MEKKGCGVYSYTSDISDRNARFDFAGRVERDVGPVDILINNAAIPTNEEGLEMSEGHFRKVTDVNYLGRVWMMQAFVPGMVKRGFGYVVNICSLAGKGPSPRWVQFEHLKAGDAREVCGVEEFEIAYPVLPEILADYARWRSDKEAVICGERRITWSELNREINRVANALLDMGLKKGEKVCTLLDNSPEMLCLIFGITKAGGVVVPLSTWLQPDAVSMMIEDSDAKAVIVGPGRDNLISPELTESRAIRESIYTVGYEGEVWLSYRHLVAEASDQEPMLKIDPTDDFNIIYSSGTTGIPKGIVHTHCARSMFGLALSSALRIHSDSRSLITTPMFTNGTWVIMVPTLTIGGTPIIMPNFDIPGVP